MTLLFAHTAPDAIGFANPQGMISAIGEDGTGKADFLCCLDSSFSRPATFTLGVKKEVGVFGAATSVVLPLPMPRLWAW